MNRVARDLGLLCICKPWSYKLWEDYRAAMSYQASFNAVRLENLASFQLSQVQSVWRDAVADVPYYRNLARTGEAPSEIRSWTDFHRLPELNRTILQSHATEFIRISRGPDFTRSTGGTTGSPVRFGVWKSEDAVLRMLKLVLWIQMGYSPDARLFLIWGHSHLLGSGGRRLFNHLQRKAKDWLAGYRREDAYVLSPSICAAMARRLIAFKPVGLIGYAAALDYFARSTGPFHSAFRQLQLRFVMPCAEPPPRLDTFATLRAAFGAPIVEEFGGVDFGHVGMRVNGKPFRIFSEHNILEAASDSNMPQGTGAALVTSLYRRYLPLIRYRQGDVISGVRRVENGHVHEFQELGGRENDMIELANGHCVHSQGFMHCIHAEPAIINAQLVVSDDGVALQVISADGLDHECEQRIRNRFERLSPELKTIRIARVLDLETTLAGKRRWFVDRRTIHDGDQCQSS